MANVSYLSPYTRIAIKAEAEGKVSTPTGRSGKTFTWASPRKPSSTTPIKDEEKTLIEKQKAIISKKSPGAKPIGTSAARYTVAKLTYARIRARDGIAAAEDYAKDNPKYFKKGAGRRYKVDVSVGANIKEETIKKAIRDVGRQDKVVLYQRPALETFLPVDTDIKEAPEEWRKYGSKKTEVSPEMLGIQYTSRPQRDVWGSQPFIQNIVSREKSQFKPPQPFEFGDGMPRERIPETLEHYIGNPLEDTIKQIGSSLGYIRDPNIGRIAIIASGAISGAPYGVPFVGQALAAYRGGELGGSMITDPGGTIGSLKTQLFSERGLLKFTGGIMGAGAVAAGAGKVVSGLRSMRNKPIITSQEIKSGQIFIRKDLKTGFARAEIITNIGKKVKKSVAKGLFAYDKIDDKIYSSGYYDVATDDIVNLGKFASVTQKSIAALPEEKIFSTKLLGKGAKTEIVSTSSSQEMMNIIGKNFEQSYHRMVSTGDVLINKNLFRNVATGDILIRSGAGKSPIRGPDFKGINLGKNLNWEVLTFTSMDSSIAGGPMGQLAKEAAKSAIQSLKQPMVGFNPKTILSGIGLVSGGRTTTLRKQRSGSGVKSSTITRSQTNNVAKEIRKTMTSFKSVNVNIGFSKSSGRGGMSRSALKINQIFAQQFDIINRQGFKSGLKLEQGFGLGKSKQAGGRPLGSVPFMDIPPPIINFVPGIPPSRKRVRPGKKKKRKKKGSKRAYGYTASISAALLRITATKPPKGRFGGAFSGFEVRPVIRRKRRKR